jgi:ComF family protein
MKKIMWQEILSTLFPKRCIGCEIIIPSSQLFLCERCSSGLPFNYLLLNKKNSLYTKINQAVKIESASSLLLFTKENLTQKLIHHLKYKNCPELGSWLAEIWFEQNKHRPDLQEIESIIPVPIHPKRLRERNYNQMTLCCKKLAHLLSCLYDENTLIRIHHMESQTQSGKYERMNRMIDAFQRTNRKSKHYLLVDDVFTTGSTLISCTEKLLEANGAKVSILALATAE